MPFVGQIALVSESSELQFPEVARVGAALQKQVVRDLKQHWGVDGTVNAFARLEDVPPGYWPVIVRDDIGFDSAGVHCDKHGQPIALVTSGPDWSLTASHEVLEMLVDPFGRQLIAGPSPADGQGRVEFLVEVSDPISDPALAYAVDGVRVSDFYTPRYFDPVGAAGVLYSFAGHVTGPRQVLGGGYLTWHDPVGDDWWQQSWFSGDAPVIRSLGKVEDVLCGLRSAVDAITARHRQAATAATGTAAGRAGDPGAESPAVSAPAVALRRKPWRPEEVAAAVAEASRAKAAAWRARCEQVIARAKRKANGG